MDSDSDAVMTPTKTSQPESPLVKRTFENISTKLANTTSVSIGDDDDDELRKRAEEDIAAASAEEEKKIVPKFRGDINKIRQRISTLLATNANTKNRNGNSLFIFLNTHSLSVSLSVSLPQCSRISMEDD